MRNLLGLVALLVVCSVIAACGSSSSKNNGGGGGGGGGTASGPDVNKKGEGQLNLVVWEGYADKSFANDLSA